ncbi:hypothetical protein M8332_05765 [Fructilactobacillus ixorae]|uniref:SIR2-like domain-containing protein n=1 Tax=Fructilactobacillus ixorae TaxID=1750535 RepID=A0ABY5C3T1_9LACO|nr:hypothetical protein [Fructilactobacillus ixorae]USS93101.1 hypothetical protein M8332_05765 [Fructilactobacillus ixorae]
MFESDYFGMLIFYYKYNDFNDSINIKNFLRDLLTAIFQLQLGALSENISRQTEESVFEKNELNLDFFDDLGGTLNINYDAAGIAGLNLLSESYDDKLYPDPIIKVAYKIVEQIYADVIDYKTLIDSNWHYLYNPKNEWAKFSKIVVFLYTVRDYIEKKSKHMRINKGGYYSDLHDHSSLINVIATTNYSNFIDEALNEGKEDKDKKNILFLNGGVDIYYDPYINSLVNKSDENDHIIVPLLFTQSGTKPMTSIDMLKKYVDFFDRLKASDYICSVGFGFHPDDEHINGIIRTLITRFKKKLVIIDVSSDDLDKKRTKLAEKLKIEEKNNIKYIRVNANTRCNNEGQKWIDLLEEEKFE